MGENIALHCAVEAGARRECVGPWREHDGVECTRAIPAKWAQGRVFGHSEKNSEISNIAREKSTSEYKKCLGVGCTDVQSQKYM